MISKKLRKYIIPILIIIGLGTHKQAICQLSLGPGLSFGKILSSGNPLRLGIDLRASYSKRLKRKISGSILYYIPVKLDGFTGSSVNASAPPTTVEIDIPTTFNTRLYGLHVGYTQYFIGDIEDDYGFYGFVEIGYYIYDVIIDEFGPYDQTLYTTSSEIGENDGTIGLTGNLGLGLEYLLDFGYLFGELYIGIPATESETPSGSVTLAQNFGFFLSITSGLRFPLGGKN